MKSFGVNKVLGSLRRRATGGVLSATPSEERVSEPQGEGPEAIAARSVTQFCKSGTRNGQGDEVLFLPPIVDAAESSPAAAAECARLIKKYLSKNYSTHPSVQYNSIMLLRILADNPGLTFTRNFADKKFVDATKDLLRSSKDASVRTMLMETLDSFEYTKPYDEGLQPVTVMWKKEKEKAYKAYGYRVPPLQQQMPMVQVAPQSGPDPRSQNYFARSHSNNKLPEPAELASRLEEARTSAKLLSQVVANTPPQELLDNDLVKEFADRCLSASRSVQGYMVAENPGPDNETMENLIDTNEQLQAALSTHQRAVLSARKQLGVGDPSSTSPSSAVPIATPALPPRDGDNSSNISRGEGSRGSSSALAGAAGPSRKNGKGKAAENFQPPPGPPPGASGSRADKALPDDPPEDPFKDPAPEPKPHGSGQSSSAQEDEAPRLIYEPFPPSGFSQSAASSGKGKDPTAGRNTFADDADLYDTEPVRKDTIYRY